MPLIISHWDIAMQIKWPTRVSLSKQTGRGTCMTALSAKSRSDLCPAIIGECDISSSSDPQAPRIMDHICMSGLWFRTETSISQYDKCDRTRPYTPIECYIIEEPLWKVLRRCINCKYSHVHNVKAVVCDCASTVKLRVADNGDLSQHLASDNLHLLYQTLATLVTAYDSLNRW